MFQQSIRVTLPEQMHATEQRLLQTFEAGAPLAVEDKRLGDRIVKRQSDVFWTGVWKLDDGRYFLVTDKEVEWFANEQELLRVMAALLNIQGGR